jgi:predicted DNA-binding transcriptional regulator YafY
MVNIRQTGEKRYIDEEIRKLDLASYGKNVFSMFGGKPINVKMRFCNELAGVVLDRFGGDSMLIPDGEQHFTFTAPVTISPAFWGWLGQFGARAKVLYPESAVEEYKTLLREALQEYE